MLAQYGWQNVLATAVISDGKIYGRRLEMTSCFCLLLGLIGSEITLNFEGKTATFVVIVNCICANGVGAKLTGNKTDN